MKKRIQAAALFLTLGVFAALAWGCGPRACDYEYEVVSRYADNCADSSECTSFYLSYPVFSKKWFSSAAVDSLNARVYRATVGTEDKTAEGMAEDFLAGYRDFLNERDSIARAEGDSTMARYVPVWYYNAECLVEVNGPEMVVTMLKFSQYEGGAHGMYGQLYANYEVASGKRFALEDVFTDTLALARKITERFIQQNELDASVPLCDQGYFIDEQWLPVTDNFALLPQGVTFHYNVYEIAPYSAGELSVIVPYGDLEGILRFKPDFEKAEVFSSDSEQ